MSVAGQLRQMRKVLDARTPDGELPEDIPGAIYDALVTETRYQRNKGRTWTDSDRVEHWSWMIGMANREKDENGDPLAEWRRTAWLRIRMLQRPIAEQIEFLEQAVHEFRQTRLAMYATACEGFEEAEAQAAMEFWRNWNDAQAEIFEDEITRLRGAQPASDVQKMDRQMNANH